MQHTTMAEEFESRMTRGAVAGLIAGLFFLLANMAFATSQGMPAVAPLLDMSTIFNTQSAPVVSPENIVIGLVTHLTLSAVFGITFAMALRMLRGPAAATLGAAGFGLALYIVNFQILGRIFFTWFQEGPNQLFEIAAHIGFGLLLLPFFATALMPSAAPARTRISGTASPAA